MIRTVLWSVALCALVAAPALAADDMSNMHMDKGKTPTKHTMPMKHTEMHKPMHHAVVRHSHHKMDCSDYAWQSQDMKDCEAKSGKHM